MEAKKTALVLLLTLKSHQSQYESYVLKKKEIQISLVSSKIIWGKDQNKTAVHAKQVILKNLFFSKLDFQIQIYFANLYRVIILPIILTIVRFGMEHLSL